MTEAKIYRQGDVLVRRVDAIPEHAKKVDRKPGERLVLAYGERTGHAHALRSDNVTAFRAETAEDRALAGLPAVDYILVGGSETVALNHEYEDGRRAEHIPVQLPPGVYQIAAQVEYTPQELVRVSD